VFDHVTIRAADRRASEAFYELVLATLGIPKDYSNELGAEWEDFSMSPATEENPPTRGLHIGFVAPSREHVDEFWRAGTAAGHESDGESGPRPIYSEDYYGSFLVDPDGNSAEAVHHGGLRTGGWVDHLWIRVADLDASKRFYATIAPFAGFELRRDLPERGGFSGGNGSFSVLEGPPTEHLHMAFPAKDDATVDAFHAAAIEAGYRDNGPPGERTIYHPGYYGAYVLDPDGNNIEVVNHNRG
jgi:catechol 2,3-dioxygenase-like lactoylglutathione lyase family enzyme